MVVNPVLCKRFAEVVDGRANVPPDEVAAFAAHYSACALCRDRHSRRELFLQKVLAAVQDADPERSKALQRWEETLDAFLALASPKTAPDASPRQSRRAPRRSARARTRRPPKSAG